MVVIKDITDLYENFMDAVYGTEKLDLKTKEIIAFSNSVMVMENNNGH